MGLLRRICKPAHHGCEKLRRVVLRSSLGNKWRKKFGNFSSIYTVFRDNQCCSISNIPGGFNHESARRVAPDEPDNQVHAMQDGAVRCRLHQGTLSEKSGGFRAIWTTTTVFHRETEKFVLTNSGKNHSRCSRRVQFSIVPRVQFSYIFLVYRLYSWRCPM